MLRPTAEQDQRARAAAHRPLLRAWLLDAVALVGLGGFALALRLPNYQLIPPFTDEVDEIYRGILVARGELIPLTNVDAYIGSLWNYLLAAAFRLGGMSLFTPRTLMLVTGVLTVLATYPLGRAWCGGRRAGGVVAALLLATSAEHIVINSRLAWSNSMTPLFSTLGVTALWHGAAGTCPVDSGGPGSARAEPGIKRRSGIWLAVAGLCWGLAFQTHPTILPLLLAAAVFLLWRGRALLRTRWLYLAACLFVLMNLNLLVYNLTTGFDSIQNALYRSSTPAYTNRQGLTPLAYSGRLARLLLALFRHEGGAVDARLIGSPEQLLTDIGLWPIALLALAGVLWQFRRGNVFPCLLLVSMVLLPPFFNGRYEPILDGRYLVPLLPILYAGIAALLLRLVDRRPMTEVRGRPVVVALVEAFLVLHPLLYLYTYYQQEATAGRTNSEIFATMDQIRAQRQPDEMVIIDPFLRDKRMSGRDGALDIIFRTALAANDVAFRLPELGAAEALDPATRCRARLMLLASYPSHLGQLLSRLGIGGTRFEATLIEPPASQYALYRLDRRINDTARC